MVVYIPIVHQSYSACCSLAYYVHFLLFSLFCDQM